MALWAWFACATIAIADWLRTEFLVRFAVSLAKSVSSILAAAAAKFAEAEYATACLAFSEAIPAATLPKLSATSFRVTSAVASAPAALVCAATEVRVVEVEE